MRKFVVTDNATQQSVTVSADEAARIAGIDLAELQRVVDQQGAYRTERHAITAFIGPVADSAEQANACFMVEDGDRHVGYFRNRKNAERVAATLADPHIGELFPPDPIACEDDETKH